MSNREHIFGISGVHSFFSLDLTYPSRAHVGRTKNKIIESHFSWCDSFMALGEKFVCHQYIGCSANIRTICIPILHCLRLIIRRNIQASTHFVRTQPHRCRSKHFEHAMLDKEEHVSAIGCNLKRSSSKCAFYMFFGTSISIWIRIERCLLARAPNSRRLMLSFGFCYTHQFSYFRIRGAASSKRTQFSMFAASCDEFALAIFNAPASVLCMFYACSMQIEFSIKIRKNPSPRRMYIIIDAQCTQQQRPDYKIHQAHIQYVTGTLQMDVLSAQLKSTTSQPPVT